MTRARDISNDQANLGGVIAPYVAGKNVLINGGMDNWQRGTSFSGSGYTADRWLVDAGTTTRQTGTGSFPYCLQIANASGNPALRQGFELPFAGNAGQFQVGTTWTISFLAKTSTSIGSQLAVYVAFNDGVNTGINPVQIALSTTVGASSTSWTRYTYTFTVASSPAGTNTCMMVVPYLASGSYAGNFSITQVQLEQGSVATPFARAGGSIGGELALCQRYYWRTSNFAVYAFLPGLAGAYSSTGAYMYVPYPVAMRAAASSIDFSTIALHSANDTRYPVTALTVSDSTQLGANTTVTVSSGLTSNSWYNLQSNSSTSAYIGISAEL